MKPALIGIRLEPELDRALATAAKREGRTKSEIVRTALRRYLAGTDASQEARRQSLRACRGKAERDAVDFVAHAADVGGDE